MRRWLGVLLCSLWLAAARKAVATESFTLLHGDWRQGSVLIARTRPGAAVEFDGRPLRLTVEGVFVFGLDRDAGRDAVLSLHLPGRPPQTLHYAVAPYAWPTQRIEGLPEDKVNPPPEAQARIEREGAALAAAHHADSALDGFEQPWLWPVRGEVSGLFGRQRVLNGTPKQPHMGLDIAVPSGTAVRTPADGVVRLSEPDLYFTGGTLVIDHGHGVFSIFAHLSGLQAKPGQAVHRGEIVARSGATGRATGPHLHWGVYWFDAHVDPLRLVAARLPG
jgi:hypothetical protein